jgi:branched-chain amino acid transport system ATP-binding protein
MLIVEGLSAGYEDFRALFDVNLSIKEGETVAIVGANGAGKTTLLRAVMGQVKLHSGSIRFDGVDISSMTTHERVKLGISLVPEGRRIFPSLTVRENLLIGGFTKRPGPWTIERIVSMFPMLDRLLSRSASKLSGGEQQAIAIGRALLSNPRLVLLDEVSLGLAPVVVKQLYSTLPAISDQGTTAIIVEQDIHQALAVSDRVYCLLEGKVTLTGDTSTVSKSAITSAYFGAAV